MNKKSNKLKNITRVIIIVVILTILSLTFLVFKTFFGSSSSRRLDGIENHELTSNEKNSIKDKISELGSVESVDVYVLKNKTKILRIYVKLSEDIDFKELEEKSNEAITLFSKDNLNFYDVEIFVESANKESEIYPQIGYKHKTNEKFSW